MIAGKLNEIITVVKPTISRNSYGASSTSWYDSYVTRASTKQNNGTKDIVNNEVFVHYTVEFEVRYYNQIDELDRIKWNNKLYQIESIVPERLRNRKIIITTLINE